jgi:hypothetical protein
MAVKSDESKGAKQCPLVVCLQVTNLWSQHRRNALDPSLRVFASLIAGIGM